MVTYECGKNTSKSRFKKECFLNIRSRRITPFRKQGSKFNARLIYNKHAISSPTAYEAVMIESKLGQWRSFRRNVCNEKEINLRALISTFFFHLEIIFIENTSMKAEIANVKLGIFIATLPILYQRFKSESSNSVAYGRKRKYFLLVSNVRDIEQVRATNFS